MNEILEAQYQICNTVMTSSDYPSEYLRHEGRMKSSGVRALVAETSVCDAVRETQTKGYATQEARL